MVKKIETIIFVVAVVSLTAWFGVQGQTWFMSPSPAPDNTTLQVLTSGAGDDLGFTSPHQGYQRLDMGGYRIYGISSSLQPGVSIISASNGLTVGAQNTYAVHTISNSSDQDQAGLYALQTAKFPALVAQGAVAGQTALAAKLFGVTTVDKSLILGNNPYNSIALLSGQGVGQSKLYWGSELLCDPVQPNCGWVQEGMTGDGLGNHIATKTLNMLNHRIYNISSTSLEPGFAALMASASNASSTIDAISVNNHGVIAESQAVPLLPDNVVPGGLYAYHQGTGPALGGASGQGNGAKISSPLELKDDKTVTPIGFVQLQFGERSGDVINIDNNQVNQNATSNIYWGDKLLCQAGASCGWATTANGGVWQDNAQGIHYPSSGNSKILIGRSADAAAGSPRLDIGHSYLAAELAANYNLGVKALTGTVNDLFVRGTTVYITSGGAFSGITAVDVATPSNPKTLASLNLGASSWGVSVAGSYAYVATANGLQVVDISNPSSFSVVGTVSLGATLDGAIVFPSDVVVRGNYAYVASAFTGGTAALQVINISQPTNPTEVKRITTNLISPRNIAIGAGSGTVNLAVADYNRGLVVYSLADPVNPNYRGTLSVGANHVMAVSIRDHYAYAAGTQLYVFDLNSLTQSGVTNGAAFAAYGIQVVDDYVYVAAGSSGGVKIYNVDNPATPVLANNPNYYTANTPRRIFLSGRYMYLADQVSGLLVMNNQGLQSDTAQATTLAVDWLSVLNNLQIANDLTIGSLKIGGRGANINGSITISDGTTGLVLDGVSLNKTKLDKMFVKAGGHP